MEVPAGIQPQHGIHPSGLRVRCVDQPAPCSRFESMLVNDPDGVRHVLATAIGKYKRPMSSYRVFRPFAGSGVLLAGGSEWCRQRRMLAPIFTPASVGLLLPHFVTAAKGLVRRIDGKTRANLSAAFQEATLDAVLRALFSLPNADLREHLAALVRG